MFTIFKIFDPFLWVLDILCGRTKSSQFIVQNIPPFIRSRRFYDDIRYALADANLRHYNGRHFEVINIETGEWMWLVSTAQYIETFKPHPGRWSGIHYTCDYGWTEKAYD